MLAKSHNLSYLLKDVMLGCSKREMQNLSKHVVAEDFSVSWVGRVFTINLPDYNEHQFYLLLAPNLNI